MRLASASLSYSCSLQLLLVDFIIRNGALQSPENCRGSHLKGMACTLWLTRKHPVDHLFLDILLSLVIDKSTEKCAIDAQHDNLDLLGHVYGSLSASFPHLHVQGPSNGPKHLDCHHYCNLLQRCQWCVLDAKSN
jgi:hypothetical protein